MKKSDYVLLLFVFENSNLPKFFNIFQPGGYTLKRPYMSAQGTDLGYNCDGSEPCKGDI